MEYPLSSRFAFEPSRSEQAKLCVVGVGGGGGNALNNMLEQGINGVEFIAINTDYQALMANKASIKIQAGRTSTKGLGAGARPAVGAEAVEESRAEIEKALEPFDMVFITAGMGGGTGTGGAPVVAAIAKKLGILTVAVVTRPFTCEGQKRAHSAMTGIELLRDNVDTMIVIPNERLIDISDSNTTLVDAFRRADEVLYNATRGISDLITVHGLINLDFADVKTTMQNGGTALMGSATAAGEGRAERAAQEAISSPLLDGLSIAGARNVLVNFTAGPDMGIRETTAATAIIQQAAGDDVEVIWGNVIDETMSGEIRVTVIATGFDHRSVAQTAPPRIHLDSVPRTQYKGEDNLRQLDEPAYIRRTHPIAHARAISDELGGDGAGRIRRVATLDQRERPEKIRKDNSDVPAFLRKMMD